MDFLTLGPESIDQLYVSLKKINPKINVRKNENIFVFKESLTLED